MTDSLPNSPLNRRDFLWLSATALTGMFGAGALAWGVNRNQAALEADAYSAYLAEVISTAPQADGESLLSAEETIIHLAEQLRQSQTQAAAYLEQLTQAEGRVAGLEAEVASLRAQLGEAESRGGLLGELLALYEQLDATDLDAIVRAGLASLGSLWAGLSNLGGLLRTGIALGETALAGLEDNLTTLRTNLQRLLPTTNALAADIEVVKTSADEAAAKTTGAGGRGNLFEPITRFVEVVLNNLPFGIGDQLAATLLLMRDVLTKLPNALSELRLRVLGPLGDYLAETGPGWQATVVNALRENLLTPATTLLDALDDADRDLRVELIDPANGALATRGQVREQISEFKATHQMG